MDTYIERSIKGKLTVDSGSTTLSAFKTTAEVEIFMVKAAYTITKALGCDDKLEVDNASQEGLVMLHFNPHHRDFMIRKGAGYCKALLTMAWYEETNVFHIRVQTIGCEMQSYYGKPIKADNQEKVRQFVLEYAAYIKGKLLVEGVL